VRSGSNATPDVSTPSRVHRSTNMPPEGVVAETRRVAHASPEARGGDRHVRRVAAEALQVAPTDRRPRLVELDERLAQRDDVRHCGGSRSACRCRRRRP
jgi:hypothetical protein